MPEAIRRLLNRLRARETALALAWAAGRAFAACIAVLVASWLIDWLVDRWTETPFALRAALLCVQAIVWLGAAAFVLAPMFRHQPDDALALRIEEAVPSLGHRLISAVQLNRPDARTDGMSPELIAATTRQAEQQAEGVDPATVSSGDRYRWAMWAAAPPAAVLALVFLIMPGTAAALLNRTFLGDADIPRRIGLEPTVAAVWPANEEGTLAFTVTGLARDERPEGHVRIAPMRSGPAFLVPLSPGESAGVYVAKLPASNEAFTYRAWLGDARMKHPGEVRYSPRPVVQSIEAWVQLPLTLARKGDLPYEEPQKAGDLAWRIPKSKARIRVTTQTPIKSCAVIVKDGRRTAQHSLKIAEDAKAERKVAEGDIPLDVESGSYEILVTCPHGFSNTEIARRSIRRLPLEPPEVALLPETTYQPGDKGTPEEREVEGIPALEGERFRLDYRATHRYGLDRARVRFLVIRQGKGDEGEGKVDPEAFGFLPLGPAEGVMPSGAAKREFDRRPAGPDALPDSEASGTYNFEVAGVPDIEGKRAPLKKGDRILYYIEAFSRADPRGKPGRSAIREKEVVDVASLLTWLKSKEDLKERTRALEEAARTARPGESP